ncbi:MFS transporter [Fusibacter sp. 3D3]|uniref:MFS transporter n=1 Tax=Fusibacter sp. 3D3 TaxID=1048380 RepID=UPI000852A615|nr:MFS transporter [Fusibacter sp. 3D3]GAU77908.1 macrolide-efflux protein [Fusibacter sp. 3D3]
MHKNWKKEAFLFLSSQIISLFGSSLVQYAIMWYITLTTKSGLMMTISIICGFLPIFFLSPFGGVWADRFDRKRLIILSDALIASSTAILAVLFFLGYDRIELLFIVSAIRAVGTAVQTPAVGAFLPQFVPADKLMRVNSISTTIQSAVLFISPMVSGALLTFYKIQYIFLIDVVTAILGISVLSTMKVKSHMEGKLPEKLNYFHDLKEGLAYIRNHAFLVKFFVYFAILFCLITPVAFLTPLQVARTFGDEVWRLTSIEIAFSSGMMIGGAVLATLGAFKNRVYTMALSGFIMGICTIAFGLVTHFPIYIGFMAVCGLSLPFFNTPSTVILQEKVEEAYMGRVFGVFGMISSSVMPLSMLIFGPLSDYIQIEWLLIATGIALVIQSLLLTTHKTLITAGEPL